jgi:rod shape-determining protein MreD
VAGVVALAAFLEAVLTPRLQVAWVAPGFSILGIVISTFGMKDLQGMLLGFFGGVLIDTLSSGLFGVGALGGLLAGFLSARAGRLGRKESTRLLISQVSFVSVLAADVANWGAIRLNGSSGPDFLLYFLTGALPDALVNALLAFIIGKRLHSFMQKGKSG